MNDEKRSETQPLDSSRIFRPISLFSGTTGTTEPDGFAFPRPRWFLLSLAQILGRWDGSEVVKGDPAMRRIALALLATLVLIGVSRAAWHGGFYPCCSVPGLLQPPGQWTAPSFQVCTPWFAGGAPFMVTPDEFDPPNVLVSMPFYQGPPLDHGPERRITAPERRPRRPADIEIPPLEPQPRPSPPPTPRLNDGKLHLVVLADKAAKDTGKTHVAGAELFHRLMHEGIRFEMFGEEEKKLEGTIEAEAIVKRIGEMSIQPEDTFVIYYAGPASWDADGKSVILTPTGAKNRLPRDELRRAALEKKARLTIILTDPAANPVIAQPPSKPQLPELTPSALENWFFNFRGVVDIHAAAPGEFAAARGEYGGVFTLAFVREFGRPAGSWADMFEIVKFSTGNIFKSYRLDVLKADDISEAKKTIFRNQETQVPVLLTPIDNVAAIRTGAVNSAPATPAIKDDVAVKAEVLPPVAAAEAPIAKEVTAPIIVKAALPARLDVRLPARAKLWIDGQPTLQIGSDRTFELPVGPNEGDSLCELRIEVNNWFGIYRVTVAPGKTVQVDLQVPAEVIKTSAK